MTTEPLVALARVIGRRETGVVLGARGEILRLSLRQARVGQRLRLGSGALVEIVGFDGLEATALPLEGLSDVHSGMPVVEAPDAERICEGSLALGRVLDGLGRPVDGGAPLSSGTRRFDGPAPHPLARAAVDRALPTGVRVIDGLCPLGAGQRLALESPPGAGKTTLLRTLAAHTSADRVVIALIGERGREIGELLSTLPEAIRARTVVVVARADEPHLLWLRAAQVATALAESLRDEGHDVLFLMDSLTRVARAIRTVGLTAGEPTTRRGYPVSLSETIARLVERTGAGARGTITALYAVLVEGQAEDDPVAEEARALLDGHLVLDRGLARAGRFPAVDPLASVSRCMAQIVTPAHLRAAATLRRRVAALAEVADLEAIGAYARGARPDVDAALARREALERFLRQAPDEPSPWPATVAALEALT